MLDPLPLRDSSTRSAAGQSFDDANYALSPAAAALDPMITQAPALIAEPLPT